MLVEQNLDNASREAKLQTRDLMKDGALSFETDRSPSVRTGVRPELDSPFVGGTTV